MNTSHKCPADLGQKVSEKLYIYPHREDIYIFPFHMTSRWRCFLSTTSSESDGTTISVYSLAHFHSVRRYKKLQPPPPAKNKVVAFNYHWLSLEFEKGNKKEGTSVLVSCLEAGLDCALIWAEAPHGFVLEYIFHEKRVKSLSFLNDCLTMLTISIT